MPVLLVDDAATQWLDDSAGETEVRALLDPFERDDLEMYEVARYVNNAANDSPECIARIHADSVGSFLL
jgi:putative SOS response-associated peptidase YedK